MVTDEVANLRAAYPDVDVETTIPDDVSVAADDLLHRVFSNLLENAVKHNESPQPRVEVNAEWQDTSVTVRITDNGKGIPEPDRATMFELGNRGNEGLGLYVERYDGQVELSDTGPDGSTFTLELQTETDRALSDDAEPADSYVRNGEDLPPLMSRHGDTAD